LHSPSYYLQYSCLRGPATRSYDTHVFVQPVSCESFPPDFNLAFFSILTVYIIVLYALKRYTRKSTTCEGTLIMHNPQQRQICQTFAWFWHKSNLTDPKFSTYFSLCYFYTGSWCDSISYGSQCYPRSIRREVFVLCCCTGNTILFPRCSGIWDCYKGLELSLYYIFRCFILLVFRWSCDGEYN
jgi:hypothetical protein